jgi:hypothetical protein
MTEIKYEIEIDVPVSVYEYYTDPENIRKAWPSDIVNKIRQYIHYDNWSRRKRKKWLQQVGIDAKALLLEYYSRMFLNATDDLNEAVFRKYAESIAKTFADAKSYLAMVKEIEKIQTN